METAIFTLLGTLLGSLISDGISYTLQKQRYHHELMLKQEEYKTEFMAENTAKHFLSHKSYTDRSFDVLQKHLGDFEDDELRKILVRAGAVRTYIEDGTK